ncbi:MAG TPA: hypothetical protein VEK11_25670 [Thermoanaerobaculia bacterium]|nr:hypothetical protein [Thermoanaerobaculia bacterium]
MKTWIACEIEPCKTCGQHLLVRRQERGGGTIFLRNLFVKHENGIDRSGEVCGPHFWIVKHRLKRLMFGDSV